MFHLTQDNIVLNTLDFYVWSCSIVDQISSMIFNSHVILYQIKIMVFLLSVSAIHLVYLNPFFHNN